MQRVRRQRHQVYKEKDFEIQSLNPLVKTAKERKCKRIEEDFSDESGMPILPIHIITERLMVGLQQMHHQLQNLMMQNLGPDARNLITAERARLAQSKEKQRLDAKMKEEVDKCQDTQYIAPHLSEIGQVHGADELELLNEYRERYAAILAELLIAREKLLEVEKGLRDSVADEALRNRMSEEIEELSDVDFDCNKGKEGSSSETEW